MSKSGFELDSSELTQGISQYRQKIYQVVFNIGEYWSAQMETSAKSGAKWTDRTGNARNGLRSVAKREGNNTVIYLYHTVEYGLWLELRWAGKYAIIMPTIQAYGSRIMDMIRKTFQ